VRSLNKEAVVGVQVLLSKLNEVQKCRRGMT